VASQLAVAANRVATIQHVHRRLHRLDGVQSVAFKQYLEDLCRDFSTMLLSKERLEHSPDCWQIGCRSGSTMEPPAMRHVTVKRNNGDGIVSLGTILLIILVIALLGGFSGFGGGPFYGTGYYGGGGLGLVLVIVLILVLLGKI
jgi:hypothetical protein